MNKTTIFSIIVIILSFAISYYYYPSMPEMVASHWNAAGEVDGYMSKFWGLFLMPIVSVFMLALFLVIPKIDPLKKNIKSFRKHFDWFILLLILFLFYIHLLTIFWNLGSRFDMSRMMLPALGILFFYSGVLIEHAKRNWFIGIRTPWTMSSDIVWNKTHKLGGKLFKIAGAIMLLGILFQGQMVWFLLVPILFAAFYTMVYSYLEYNKLKGKKKK